MKKLIVVAIVILGAWSGMAQAGQSAQIICLEGDQAQSGECPKFKLQIKIRNDKETGMRGANGIFATSDNGLVAYWTEDNGWVSYTEDSLIKPVRPGLRVLETEREYEVFAGSQETLCKMSRGHNFNLYAWHVGLGEAQIKKTQAFLTRFSITGWQAENFLNSTMFYLSTTKKQGGLVYSVSCQKKS